VSESTWHTGFDETSSANTGAERPQPAGGRLTLVARARTAKKSPLTVMVAKGTTKNASGSAYSLSGTPTTTTIRAKQKLKDAHITTTATTKRKNPDMRTPYKSDA